MAGAFDTQALRNAFGAFATGVTVVTTREENGTPRGFTANSFTSVSLNPPLLLVCIAKSAASLKIFENAPHFAVNILSEDQKAISGLFASRQPDKFEHAAWKPGPDAVPLIDASLAWFSCTRAQCVDAGDHVILIGHVTDFDTRAGNPLGYFRGNYFSLGLDQPLVEAVARDTKSVIGAILARGTEILLDIDPQTAALTVPNAKFGEKGEGLDTLIAALAACGMRAEIDFLYSVYRNRASGANGIYYHGIVSGDAPAGRAFFDINNMPWERVTDAAQRSMLQRYSGEYAHGSFGIYEGDEDTGRVRKIGNQG